MLLERYSVRKLEHSLVLFCRYYHAIFQASSRLGWCFYIPVQFNYHARFSFKRVIMTVGALTQKITLLRIEQKNLLKIETFFGGS